MAKYPGRLGGAEVGVEHQAGHGAHPLEMTVIGERRTVRCGAAVLPDDGAVQRSTGRSVEGDDGLTLVGDADGGDRVTGLAQAGAHLAQRLGDGVPDLVGIVLDPSGPREILGQLAVGDVGHSRPFVDGDGPHAGRAGVNCDDCVGHEEPTLFGHLIRSAGEGLAAL